MRKRGILLAAPGSGSGKTTITCALLAALKKRNIPVRSFKSGPDYIDPMFHSRVIGIPSRNLDTFFSEASQIQELYDYGEEGMFSVIEGAMGIYDGLGGTQKEGSAYHLAQTLDLSVILGWTHMEWEERFLHFLQEYSPMIRTNGLPVLF